MRKNRRALVLVDESAGHPFLRSLPPHVRSGGTPDRAWRGRMPIDLGDWRGFFAAYCAAFMATTIFIA